MRTELLDGYEQALARQANAVAKWLENATAGHNRAVCTKTMIIPSFFVRASVRARWLTFARLIDAADCRIDGTLQIEDFVKNVHIGPPACAVALLRMVQQKEAILALLF
jgi:hypothetical protein